ncbi:MAG: hypothetical protein ACI4F1_00600 [Bariatricus sp.]
MIQGNRSTVANRYIFGSYIWNTRVIPGREEAEDVKEKQQQLFEMIEDYIEQA